MDVDELARRTGTHRDSLRRLLLALTALGVVVQDNEYQFELAELGRSLRAGADNSVRAQVMMLCGAPICRSWTEFGSCLRTGESGWPRANGQSVVEYVRTHPEEAAVFNTAMAEHTRDAAPGLVGAADLERFTTVMDLGGGRGTMMIEILRAHPELKGVLFDAPTALSQAESTLQAAGLAGRCRIVAGDVFSSVPKGADAYILEQVLRDWPDEPATQILRNVRAAMPPTSRLLVFEPMVPALVSEGDAYPLLIDMLVLTTTGGKVRTRQEFDGLFESAGLEISRVSDPLPPFHYRVIEVVTRSAAGGPPCRSNPQPAESAGTPTPRIGMPRTNDG
jgi:O-methyltransferase domain